MRMRMNVGVGESFEHGDRYGDREDMRTARSSESVGQPDQSSWRVGMTEATVTGDVCAMRQAAAQACTSPAPCDFKKGTLEVLAGGAVGMENWELEAGKTVAGSLCRSQYKQRVLESRLK